MSTVGVLLGLAAAAGVVLIAVGMRTSQATDATALLRERLIRQELGLGQSAIALQLERPLSERLTAPIRKAITRQMTRLTPAAQQANFQRELDFIGNPFGLDPAGVQTLRIAAAAGLGALGIAIGILIGQPFALIVALVAGLILGFYLPILWLRQLVTTGAPSSSRCCPTPLTWSPSAWRPGSAWTAPWSSWCGTRRVRSRWWWRAPCARSSSAGLGPRP
jgi:hypothetical protein